MNSVGFADIEQMRLAIADIQRYQHAYMKCNNKGILVRWKKGWFVVGKKPFENFVRPTAFRNMTDVLERRIKDKEI